MITSSSFGAFGAAGTAATGACPAHPTHKARPSASVQRLQRALRGLASRVGAKAVSVATDGLVGPRTVKATNIALSKYAKGAPAPFTTGRLTHGQVVSFAAQLAAIIERAPIAVDDDSLKTPEFMQTAAKVAAGGGNDGLMVPSFAQDQAPAPSAPLYTPPTSAGYAPAQPPPRGVPMYPQAPPYYYGPPRGPGGLPADRASLDVKAFLPAQYEHIRLEPGMGMAIVVFGLAVAFLIAKKKKETK